MKKSWLIAIIVAYILVRIYIASLSSFSFFQGGNEGHYSLIAKGYFDHSLFIQGRGGGITWSVPPFYSWVLFASFKLIGISDISGRLLSIIATLFAVPFIYLLAREIYKDTSIASLSIVIFLLIPWVVHLSGRIQTDMLMTSLMTASIACFLYAYNHKTSFYPFGIFFGLALFTKQPSILILVIVTIWMLLVVNKNERIESIKKISIPVLIGFVPILVYMSYHILNGETQGVVQLFYGEGAYRMVLFSNFMNTLGGIIIGISPLVLFFAFYEIYKQWDLKNILFIWIIIYGFFVIARTPASHEYYIIPLSIPFAILAAKGIFNFKSSFKLERKTGTLLLLLVILSTIPISYVFLTYTGDLGYISTREVSSYMNEDMAKNPEEKYFIILHRRYESQLKWYMNLTKNQTGDIGNDLTDVSVNDIEKIANSSNATKIFLIIDGRGGLEDRLDKAGYRRSYISYYQTNLPSLFSKIYTGEESKSPYFEQHLSIYELNIWGILLYR